MPATKTKAEVDEAAKAAKGEAARKATAAEDVPKALAGVAVDAAVKTRAILRDLLTREELDALCEAVEAAVNGASYPA